MPYTPVIKHLRSSDGHAIYAEAIGNLKNPHVILAHGLTLTAAAFNNLFEDQRLLEKVYLVRYDLRGHGRSGMPSNPEGYASSLFADDYAEVLRAFDVKNPIHVGWSYGCTVAADVCTHITPNPIRGLVYLAALPYIGPIMGRVGTPTVLGFLPGLMNETDVALSCRTKVEFAESVFTHPERVDFDLKASWIGQGALQPPSVTKLIATRAQDPQKLLEAGQNGLPMLVLNGTADKQVQGDVVVQEMKPYFKDMDVVMVEGGSHALFYEYQKETVDALLKFVERVVAKNP
ncbi:Alpha/Beta hydrolase protein [Rhodofomes roseus]|uniref:Alpha/Beta hydrolase protein n=1 Tax=Rhodofomes roseus TaxID=34475 RepID=A0ABQ8KR18_9APHY|nr:Alpha/Beta hydrolase protein [Rhodofomes roseus]KAH9841068.1 Alpha/Beta hydrolase protein [Rhodofomes roseus]